MSTCWTRKLSCRPHACGLRPGGKAGAVTASGPDPMHPVVIQIQWPARPTHLQVEEAQQVKKPTPASEAAAACLSPVDPSCTCTRQHVAPPPREAGWQRPSAVPADAPLESTRCGAPAQQQPTSPSKQTDRPSLHAEARLTLCSATTAGLTTGRHLLGADNTPAHPALFDGSVTVAPAKLVCSKRPRIRHTQTHTHGGCQRDGRGREVQQPLKPPEPPSSDPDACLLRALPPRLGAITWACNALTPIPRERCCDRATGGCPSEETPGGRPRAAPLPVGLNGPLAGGTRKAAAVAVAVAGAVAGGGTDAAHGLVGSVRRMASSGRERGRERLGMEGGRTGPPVVDTATPCGTRTRLRPRLRPRLCRCCCCCCGACCGACCAACSGRSCCDRCSGVTCLPSRLPSGPPRESCRRAGVAARCADRRPDLTSPVTA